MRHDLVIFDNDGVLVDSGPLANRILAEYLTELGVPTTYQECLRDHPGPRRTASTTGSESATAGRCPRCCPGSRRDRCLPIGSPRP